MIPYIKIETIFLRDTNGTKKVIEGKFQNETVEYLKDNQWLCSEKIDGTNIQVCWDGYKVTFNGRSEGSQIPSTIVNKLNDLFGGNVNEEMFEQKFGDMPVTLYFEGYGPGIQKCGKLYRDDVSVVLFDVYLPTKDLWLKRDSIEDIAKYFGVDIVDIILIGTLQEAVDFIKTKPKSHIGNADMEGLVCRPAIEVLDRQGRRVITKIKAKDFAA